MVVPFKLDPLGISGTILPVIGYLHKGVVIPDDGTIPSELGDEIYPVSEVKCLTRYAVNEFPSIITSDIDLPTDVNYALHPIGVTNYEKYVDTYILPELCSLGGISGDSWNPINPVYGLQVIHESLKDLVFVGYKHRFGVTYEFVFKFTTENWIIENKPLASIIEVQYMRSYLTLIQRTLTFHVDLNVRTVYVG